MKEKLIEHMKNTGEWGQFFPGKYAPIAYNQTVAQEYLPLTKEEVLKRGWKWEETVSSEELRDKSEYKIPDSTTEVTADILKTPLTCQDTGKQYKIIKQELDFYQKLGLPIPRLCPEARHQRRMDIRPPRKLYSHKCSECAKQILTPYQPSRPERVLCETCYLSAVH